jgi:hypothetical protein
MLRGCITLLAYVKERVELNVINFHGNNPHEIDHDLFPIFFLTILFLNNCVQQSHVETIRTDLRMFR